MMEKINAVITGVGGYVPDYVLTNEEISRMVDTNDEWIYILHGCPKRDLPNGNSSDSALWNIDNSLYCQIILTIGNGF